MSLVCADGATVVVTESTPGMLTVDSAAISTPGWASWAATATDHAPAPPPASVRLTVRVPPLTGNEIPVGAAKSSGLSARTRLIRPPPWRSTEASRPSSVWTGSPVWTSADLIWATVQVGCRSLSSATPPAT